MTRKPPAAARPRKLPVSGSEPVFTDLIYGTHQGRVNNNCYAWALDAYRGSGGVKLQPGNLSGRSSNMNASSCRFLRSRTLADNRKRGMYTVPPAQKCRKGYYKIMAFIDKGNDYHWYKNHRHLMYRVEKGETLRSIAKDLGVRVASITTPTPSPLPGDLVFVKGANVFSHKQGFATGPLLRDASHKTIPDPRAADRNYGEYNYRTFCGAMCVRNVKANLGMTQPEANTLHALLHKRIGLMNSGREQANQLGPRGAEVKRRNAGKV